MKLNTILSLSIATAAALVLAAPSYAQRRGGNTGSGANHGGTRGGGMQGGISQGGARPGFNRGNANFHGGNRFYRGRHYGGANFFFGGFYPYGYGYGYGYPYFAYGYPYGYGYPYYYGYGYPAYSYDPQGVYNGRVVPRGQERNREERDPKDQSSVEARVQQQLAEAGYYRGSIDGIVGEGTRRAIRSYERANGLRVDGRIDNELLSTMGIG